MTLVAVDAVVDISRHVIVVEVVRVVSAVAPRALEYGIVVRIGMARRADSSSIAVVGRERRVLRMIERGVCPGRGVVTRLARGGEELGLRRVARVRRVVVVGLVAANTSRRQRCVVVVDVTIGTLPRRHQMRAG